MPSPFPGMDPYLEGPLLWHDVHQALASQIRQQLAPRLAPRYVARLETRFVASTPDEQVRLVTVEVRDVARNRLVTSIEILSPINKRPGGGLDEYRAKRMIVLSARAHLLEIDLLREGTRPPRLIDLPQSDYFVFLTRAGRSDRTETWPIGLRDPLPTVPVPLLPGDPDVALDLDHALRAIYDEARYDLSIDYARSPTPPLPKKDTVWAEPLLARAKRET
jgi:hypothetical protein